MICLQVITPVVTFIQTVVATLEYILIQICRLIEEIVEVVTKILKWLCNTVVKTVCGAVCSVVCGICDFFCGIFGCSCGCRNVCNNVCNTVSEVVCGWTEVVETVLQAVTKLVCSYILKAIIVLLNVVVAIISMILTWLCYLVDWFIRWLLCWTYIAEIFNSRAQRRFTVAPKVVPNGRGHSDWFVYVSNPDDAGNVDQQATGFILGDRGQPLQPIVDRHHSTVSYVEVETAGDVITGRLRRERGQIVHGWPLMYLPAKVMEIGSHLFGDIFTAALSDDGTGTTPEKNLFTYNPDVQNLLLASGDLDRNSYNRWPGKNSPSSADHFGDGTIDDFGLRVDTDATCSRPTNTFLTPISDIQITPGNTDIAEQMSCGAGQTLTLDETNWLIRHKAPDACAVTTYFVTDYESGSENVGCNDWLGFTITTARGLVANRVAAYSADRLEMMRRIVDNLSSTNENVVRVAETYLHELGHQSGLTHDEDRPDCANDTSLDITKLMAPGANVRRALTRIQWCMVRGTCYVTRHPLPPFLIAAELEEAERVGSRGSPLERRDEQGQEAPR